MSITTRLSLLLYEIFPHMPKPGGEGIRIIIECSDETTAHYLKSAILRDVRKNASVLETGSALLSIKDLKVVGVPVEIRATIS